MAISYNKLWKILIDKKMSRADLRKAAEIAPNTMTKMRRDEPVHLHIGIQAQHYRGVDECGDVRRRPETVGAELPVEQAHHTLDHGDLGSPSTDRDRKSVV